MSFDLSKEYFEQDTGLEEKENLSIEEALQEVDKVVSTTEPTGLSFGTEDHVLGFDYVPDEDEWRVLVIWQNQERDDLSRSGLPTEIVKEVLQKYSEDGEWLEMLENWEGHEEDEIVELLKEKIKSTDWELNTDFNPAMIELRAEDNQFVLDPDKAETVNKDEVGISINSQNYTVMLSQDGSIQFIEE